MKIWHNMTMQTVTLSHTHITHSTLYLSMAKKKPTSSDAPPSTCTSWDAASEAALIDFHLENNSEAGNGINFKALTFKKATIHLIPFALKGGAKNPASCTSGLGSVLSQLF